MRHNVTYICLPFFVMLFLPALIFADYVDPDELRALARSLTPVQITEYESLAAKGDPKALVVIGLLRMAEAKKSREDASARKATDTKDYEQFRAKRKEGLELFTKAAEKDYGPAQYLLAEQYEAIELAGVNCELVNKWLDRSIELRYPPGISFKAFLYETNRCNSRDYLKAIDLLKLADSLGYRWASYRIGKFYSQGIGVPQDEQEAHKWYLAAAEAGFAAAQNEVGIRVSEGTGVKSNNQLAVEWFKKSAEQGNVYGACNLALHYTRGHGIAKNPLLALKWMYISHSLDGLKCFPNDYLKYLKPSKTFDKQARQLAVAWLRQHPSLTNNFDQRP